MRDAFEQKKAENLVGDPEELPKANEPTPDYRQQLEDCRVRLLKYFARKLHGRGDPEDLVQDVFTRFITLWRSGQAPVRNVVALCFKIAHGLWVDSLRKRKNDPLELNPDIMDFPEGGDILRNTPFDRLAAEDEVQRIVACLDDQEQKLAYLDKWAEESNEAIAAALEVSVAVVRARKTQLNKKLIQIGKKEG